MAVKKPTMEQLKKIAEGFNLNLTDEDLSSFQEMMKAPLESYNRLNQLVEPSLPVKYPRTPGYRPSIEENPYNAWYRKTSVQGKSTGKLAGKTVVLKDNISLAGVPMMNGSAILEGFVPDEDATIVTRILDAGGEIVGKAVCEDLCLSGGSHTSATGPVLNPHDLTRSTGGSSSGCAALVAAGEVDMAIGGDQGGSIRMPSSWSGLYGLKPTYGLVPYTGIFPIEQTIDHTGPIARTVEDVALLLEVLAGDDGLDPRQSGLEVKRYTDSLVGNAEGIKVGIVTEGFGWDGLSEEDVDHLVRQAAYSLEDSGAAVKEVSIPMHRDGVHIWNGIGIEGLTSLMVKENGMGTNWKGHYSTKLLDAYGKARKTRADEYSETVKMTMLLGQYMQDQYNGKYYAIAQNVARKLKQAYDNALQEFDVLIMPTTPMKATKIPSSDASREEIVTRALETIYNTAPFNITGHPAISVPCAKSEGLPVGMMIVGRHGEDDIVLRAAHAFQSIHETVTVSIL
ncbi:amidase [Aneurinibacillus sp. Ricciae_BoGa-3]|uniref:amidase n=1 Tax=Aneurinibacillus sp. Ricciae_BoGa-3 TaxID=3022697 RepID=UPI00233F9435|nr:amidase [Aneurinibacillus sp. Ricciae_BoGa-3]WCK55646.1 amidase [Aneurinibacillus sp. Ricciae_BoGa-3]